MKVESDIDKAATVNPIKEFQEELEQLINKHSIENICDVPDFLLAEMCVATIVGAGPTIKKVLDWHGCDSVCHPRAEFLEKFSSRQ